MKFYGKAEETARKILDLFRAGDVPAALANVFLRFDDKSPCRRWSWSNRLLTALAGYADARGYRQWEEVGRHVRKGEHAFYILSPLQSISEEPDGTTRARLHGFKATPVFGYEQTEGEELPDVKRHAAFLDALPLLSVAQSWGLKRP